MHKRRKEMNEFVWHIYESYDKQEVLDFFEKTEPDIFKTYTRRDIVDFDKIIYGLKWWKKGDSQ